jgi:hypothetical protein
LHSHAIARRVEHSADDRRGSRCHERVLKRLDAELAETDDEGRPLTYGKVAVVAVVGNEDGAHKIVADLFQALDDCGFTVPLKDRCTGTAKRCPEPTTKNSTRHRNPSPTTTRSLAADAHLAGYLISTPIRWQVEWKERYVNHAVAMTLSSHPHSRRRNA